MTHFLRPSFQLPPISSLIKLSKSILSVTLNWISFFASPNQNITFLISSCFTLSSHCRPRWKYEVATNHILNAVLFRNVCQTIISLLLRSASLRFSRITQNKSRVFVILCHEWHVALLLIKHLLTSETSQDMPLLSVFLLTFLPYRPPSEWPI